MEVPAPFGDYRLLRRLGSGGMGTVFEAEHTATARRVALKVLGHELDSPRTRQRFLREGRLAASVSHPNSLYVFGTEEIEGCPVITMEIAAGGTLHDRLQKRGPLPVDESVDALLDVIRGLEAAHAAGVLHRDIKPSNCFVSADGSVKIGDFGLSVSTKASSDSERTGTGVILGTPAFAAPEQLRGGDLDLRADIYSVGATLYTLLTGRPPIEGRNPVEVVAAALENKPAFLTELRADVPAGLAQVVARCLAKKPEQRYPDYAALRDALLPFSSARVEPASLGRRAFAGFLDVAVAGIFPAVSLHAFLGFDVDDRLLFTERSPSQVLAWIGIALVFGLYHAILEGAFGAGLGKALMGLQVRRVGGRAPGLGRILVRSLLFTLCGNLGKAAAFLTMTPEQFDEGGMIVVTATSLFFGLLPYACMRRANGLATAWDLVTGTRVTVRPRGASRPALRDFSPSLPPARKDEHIGPFVVTEEIAGGRWIAARDPALQRPVWLRSRTEELSTARRDVARPGRNRWLQSVETPATTWDVFGAPPGACLTDRIGPGRGVAWESLRHWIHDLACELAAASKDGTLPPALSRAHVWITAEGRAVLLDEAWPRARPSGQLFQVDDLAGRQRFLQDIAAHVDPTTVPLHARATLQSLAEGSFEKLSFLTGSFRALLGKSARVDRQLRAASLLSIPLFLVAFLTLIVTGEEGSARTAHEDLSPPALVTVLVLFALGSCLALPQLLGALAIRATPGQFVFGFCVVDATGAPAGRARLVARWLLSWSLPSASFFLLTRAAPTGIASSPFLAVLLLLAWLLGLAVAVLRPTRGLQDRWTGCWLVPR